jgi:hypothetical protein
MPGQDTESAPTRESGADEVAPDANAAIDESDLVTGFAAQPLEIMRPLPKLQPAPNPARPAPQTTPPSVLRAPGLESRGPPWAALLKMRSCAGSSPAEKRGGLLDRR